MKYLVSPAFKYLNDFILYLEKYHESESSTRALVHPINNGLTVRNLNASKVATVEVTGKLVYVDWYEEVIVNEMLVPYHGQREIFNITDVEEAVSRIHGFLTNQWSIEKDV